eukprot:5693637-Ditylum_brightwellii.AAC.1
MVCTAFDKIKYKTTYWDDDIMVFIGKFNNLNNANWLKGFQLWRLIKPPHLANYCFCQRNSELGDNDDSFASEQHDKTGMLNGVDTMQFNNEDSNDFNVFDDIEEHLKCTGHTNL